MLQKIIIVFGIIGGGSVFAQAENFTGTSVAFNTGFNSTNLKVEGQAPFSTNSTPSIIDTSYTFALSPKVTLAIGINYDLTDTPVISSGDWSEVEWLLKNHYSINIEPGYVLSENTLGYIKLAYHSARSYYKAYSSDSDIYGIGYGFGTKVFISKDLFLNLEIQKTDYAAFTQSSFGDVTVKHTTTTSTIGIGYRF